MAYTPYNVEFSTSQPYYSFNEYTKLRFGVKVGKASLDAGFGCAHRASSGGCAFCNLDAYAPSHARVKRTLSEQIEYARLKQPHYAMFYAYFQLGTNTGAPVEQLRDAFLEALNNEAIAGLMIGTRVDELPAQTLDMLSELANRKEVWLELGLQSTNNEILRSINRGHTFEDYEAKINEIDRYKNLYATCHMIVGLPGESRESIVEGFETLSALPLTGVKIHQLQVVKGSSLEKRFEETPFPLFEPEEYADIVAEIIAHTNPRFVIERLIGDVHAAYLIAPKWGRHKLAVQGRIMAKLLEAGKTQGADLKR